MKYFVVVAISALFVAGVLATPVELNEEQKASAKKYVDECIDELKLSEEDAAKVRAKDYSEPSEQMKCFANCFFEKAGIMKEGVLQESVVLEKLTPILGEEKTRSALGQCADIKGENKCDTAVKSYLCFEKAKATVA